MKVVVFASGSPLSTESLRMLNQVCEVVAVVIPRRDRGLTASLGNQGRMRALRSMCRRSGISIVTSNCDDGLKATISRLMPDMIWVPSFPHLIDPEILGGPPLGAFNIHFSLLPRHRGPSPLFWTYLNQDSETGVTIHWLSERMDAGPIEAQRRILLARGTRGAELYESLVSIATDLIPETLKRVEAGRPERIEQDEHLATQEPRPRHDNWAIDFETYSAEALWHFLRGVGDTEGRFRIGGRALGPAANFNFVRHGRNPGEIDWGVGGSVVYCSDGLVTTEALSPRGRLRDLIRRATGAG